jgi:hypothetical protein
MATDGRFAISHVSMNLYREAAMKLATLKDGTRDGQLIVVSRDLTRAVPAQAIVPTMQAAIDHWNNAEPRLSALYDGLNAGKATGGFSFDPKQAAAPGRAPTSSSMRPRVLESWRHHGAGLQPATGLFISCFPHKIRGASAGWTRAVAIFDDRLILLCHKSCLAFMRPQHGQRGTLAASQTLSW